MNNRFVGQLLAFKGEDEYVSQTNVLLEITDIADGEVEIAFDAPIPGKPRFYLRVPFAELAARIATWGDK